MIRPRPWRRSTAAAGALALAASATAVATTALPAAASETHSPAVVVSQMTGPGSLSDTDDRWAITGTDLGIMWDNGAGEVLTALGDTFGVWSGPGGGGGDWRSNVLLRSSDTDLSDGMTFDSAVEDRPGHAGEIIPSLKIDGTEMTTIPTAGIAVDDRQYLAFMSVRQWGPPGQWDTNHSRIAWSDDNGETWNSTDGPTWDNTAAGDHPFQMVAFERRDGFVYMFGTPNGRLGAAHVARVPEADVLDKGAYTYWDGTAWSPGDGTNAAAIVDPAVAELSVRYDEFTGSWLMMYLDGNLDVVLRTAATPEGPWSASQVVASFADYPGLYGGYMHPWSADGELYVALSQWDPYNVFLLRVQIDADGTVVNPNLIRDPSFERATSGAMPAPWQCTGPCGIDSNHSWAYAGSKQAWMRHNTGWIDVHQDVPVQPHTTYTFSGFVVTGGTPAEGTFGVRAAGPGGATLASTTFEHVDRYTRYSVTFHSGNRTSVQAFVGTNLDGDRWVQIDDLALVEAAEQIPMWQVGATSEPATGGQVRAGDVVTYEVTVDEVTGDLADAVVTADLTAVLDDATWVDGSLTVDGAPVATARAVGTAERVGDLVRWGGSIEAGDVLTLGFQVQVAADGARGDSTLTQTVTAEAPGAVLLDCTACRTSVLTAVDTVVPPPDPTDEPTDPGAGPTDPDGPTPGATDPPPAGPQADGPRGRLSDTGAGGGGLAVLAALAVLATGAGIVLVRRGRMAAMDG